MAHIECDKVGTGSVAWIWLNRPERLNALDGATLDGLEAAVEELGNDESVRAIVLAGRGRAFCAGLDLAWLASLNGGDLAAHSMRIARVFDAVEACPRPVIAAVQGAAIGGGLLLALAADFVVAAEPATFSAPEVKISIFPALSLVPRLERRVGLAAARQMLLLGEMANARQAEGVGLVDEVVPADALAARAQELGERLAALPATAVRRIKLAFGAVRRPDYAAWELAQVAACWDAPERPAALSSIIAGK